VAILGVGQFTPEGQPCAYFGLAGASANDSGRLCRYCSTLDPSGGRRAYRGVNLLHE
jgi:hypothetical protein